jgi:hypothetical protein
MGEGKLKPDWRRVKVGDGIERHVERCSLH